MAVIVTDGNTLLGADDKAGIAEIITGVEYLKNHPEIKHGDIMVGITPDEEIGYGADHFDVEKFGAKYAYTFDGGEVCELEYENFNAATAIVTIAGRNVHPGSAKNKMVNSIYLAAEVMDAFPKSERPETTEVYEGFYHLNDMEGSAETTTMTYIIRGHDRDKFEERKEFFQKVIDELGAKHNTIIIQLLREGKSMPTIKDVAGLARVSVATLSRYLNDSGYVSEYAREKIAKAIKVLDYTPNEVARSLYKKTSKLIGLLVPQIDNPYFNNIITGVESVCNEKGFHLIISNVSENKDEKNTLNHL